jgi:hypothetical protein
MAANPPFGTVVHLTTTGHVLAAVSSGKLEPTLAQLTGDDHVRVRFPGDTTFVSVASDVLTATRIQVTTDVLDRPLWYTLDDTAVPLALGPAPVVGAPTAGTAGKKCVVVWQSAETSFAEDAVLDANGKPPAKTAGPPGATARLVAYEEGQLFLENLP